MAIGVDAAPILDTREALSGVFGSISLAAWVFLLLPQLWENYRAQNAEGISLAFLLVWFIGDLTNFFGSAWADLVPTVIALAIYFCFADAILISQCLYYNIINNRKAQRELSANINSPNEALPDDPTQPLLRRLSNGDNIGLPGSRRRSSTSMKRRSSNLQSPLLPTIDEEESSTKIWMKNASAVVGICLIGTAGWAAADWAGWWVPTPRGEDSGEAPRILGAEVLGYVSAVCYLGARIPQIFKNYQEKSCEGNVEVMQAFGMRLNQAGLSLLFFILSLIGNATYGASILLHSMEAQYFLKNLPWLIGSLGTIAEDAVIFVQFHIYTERRNENVESVSAIE